MLEAEVGDMIAERIEEVIVAVVMGAEKFLRLLDQVPIVIPDFGGCVEGCGAIGGDIHFGRWIRRERDNFQKFSGDHGRVDQRIQRDSSEMNVIAVLAAERERSAELPALGKVED